MEKIVGIALDERNQTIYKVQWVPSWVQADQLLGCEQLVSQFLLNQQSQQFKEETNNNNNNQIVPLIDIDKVG